MTSLFVSRTSHPPCTSRIATQTDASGASLVSLRVSLLAWFRDVVKRDGREAEPLQYLAVATEELYEEDVVPIQDDSEVKDGFKAEIDIDFILNENGERIAV